MTSDFDIGKITEAFAAAAIDSSRWTCVVDMVSAATGSFGAVIFPNRGALPYIPVCASMFETFDIYVRDGWIDNDERNHGIPLLLEKGVITDLDIWPQEHPAERLLSGLSRASLRSSQFRCCSCGAR
jgi:hypothetical protein